MKLIVAVLRKEDEADTIAELNKKGFFVTELATTGGFLKEKNTTLLIGTDDHKLDAVLAILKQEAGLRKTVTYAATPMESGNFCPGGNYSVPIDTPVSYTHLDVYKRQGVFVDTMVICLVTGLAVGVTGAAEGILEAEKADGAAMVIQAFESVFGPAGGYVVAVGILPVSYTHLSHGLHGKSDRAV